MNSYQLWRLKQKNPTKRGIPGNRWRYLEIVYKREVQRKTLKQVGKEVGLTRERIRQLTMPI